MAKRIIEVESNEVGLEALLGEHVMLWCLNYIYYGKLTVVNEKFVTLEDPSIVYETGPLGAKSLKDAQELPSKEWNVMLSAIESFGRRDV